MMRYLAVATASLMLTATCVRAAPPELPPGVFAGEPDVKAAAAGTYGVDPSHTAVIAKVSHIGYGLSVFRFDIVEGTLTWDPDRPEQSRLEATITTASIATPVAGFAKQLSGTDYLNAAAYPKATFTSTAFHRTDDTHGTVDGTLTFLGKTHPLNFEVTLEGAGKGYMGHSRLGVEARARLDPQDYGMSPLFGAPILIEVDAEFEKR